MKLLKHTFLLVLSICMLSLGAVNAKAKQKKEGVSETFPEVAKCFQDPDYSAELAIEVAIHLAFAAQNDKNPGIKNDAKQSLHNWMKEVTHAKGEFIKHMDAWPKTHAKQFGEYLTKLADQGHEGLIAAEQFAKEVKINWKAPADHKHRQKPESKKAKKKQEKKDKKKSANKHSKKKASPVSQKEEDDQLTRQDAEMFEPEDEEGDGEAVEEDDEQLTRQDAEVFEPEDEEGEASEEDTEEEEAVEEDSEGEASEEDNEDEE